MIMLMGNEIKLSKGELSYCLFESNWIEQTRASKRNFLIFNERLKKEQNLVVGKIYILSLSTFTSASESESLLLAFVILVFLFDFRFTDRSERIQYVQHSEKLSPVDVCLIKIF